MKKRVGFAYLTSVLLAAAAFVVLMLKLFGPATRFIALGVYACSWVLLIYAIRRHARVVRRLTQGARVVRHTLGTWQQEILAVSGLVLLGVLGVVLLPPTDGAFLTLSGEALREQIRDDVERVRRASHGLERHVGTFLELTEQRDARNLADKAALREAWASYVDYAVELDQLIDVHEHFYQINPVTLPVERADSFVVAFLALAEQLRSGLTVRPRIARDPALETLLDEASPEHGLAARSYFALSQGLLRPDGLIRLQAGLAHLTMLRAQGRFVKDGERDLADRAQRTALAALAALGANADAVVDNPLTLFETTAFAAWFPLQRSMANRLGDIRVRDRPYFVDRNKLVDLRPRLQPMDVMLERRNWYLTNIGLPGFWPHAALYVGDLARLDDYFPEPVVRARTEHGKLSEYLAAKRPEVFEALQRADEHGHPMSVLEAIGEGVVFQSFEHSGNADYLAVLRPTLEPEQKLEALLRALNHHQKPYDFDFDFVTDGSIVCSELVYKSLQGVGEVHFELRPSAGRELLTPNQIVQKFAEERDQPNPALEFVAFLDGSESEATAHARDAEALRQSWRRPKWDIAQP